MLTLGTSFSLGYQRIDGIRRHSALQPVEEPTQHQAQNSSEEEWPQRLLRRVERPLRSHKYPVGENADD